MSEDPAHDIACECRDCRVAELEWMLNEQAVVNGKGSEREAALLAKVERLERENATLQEQLKAAEVLQKAAKIKELKQEIHYAMTFGENTKP